MGKRCSNCQQSSPLNSCDDVKSWLSDIGISDPHVEQMTKKDGLCAKCYSKILCKHAVVVYNYFQQALMPDEFEDVLKAGHDWVRIAKAEMGSSVAVQTKTGPLSTPISASMAATMTPSNAVKRTTTPDDMRRLMQTRHDKTKKIWDKNGVLQYKDENIAILKRVVGAQVQFIVACSQLTNEGYRLMAIDEGMQAHGTGLAGGINAFFYFQRVDLIR